jgi:rare lipoprotein A
MTTLFYRLLLIGAGAASLTACATPRYAIAPHGGLEGSHERPFVDPNLKGTMKPYEINGVWYTPREQPGYDQTGIASWYGEQFHNGTTADGEVFDMDRVSAAHKTLPLPSTVEVTNLDNGSSIVVRVNDRGPFVDGRIIDLSRAAAEKLGFRDQGTARVRVRYLGPAKAIDAPQQVASAAPRHAAYAPALAPAPAANPADASPWVASGDSSGAIATAELPPPPASRLSLAQAQAPTQGALPIGTPVWQVQAGAFSSRQNADRVAELFTSAHVEPLNRNGVTLWRVVLGPANSAQAADLLRDQAAAAGFGDATVLGPMQ